MIPFEIDISDTTVVAAGRIKRPLLIPHPDIPNDWILQIDNTTMEYFQTCPRSAQFYCVERREKGERAPLIFGGAIHEGLEVLYRDGFSALPTAKARCLDYFASQPSVQVGEWRTPEYALEALDRYVSYWSMMDNLEPIVHNGKKFVEQPFALNLGKLELNCPLPYSLSKLTADNNTAHVYVKTLHIQWTGKVDIAATNASPAVYIVDHKTTSMGGMTFFADFELAQQTHGYTWALQKLLGHRVAGFILNALIIRKPTRTGVGMEFERRVYPYSEDAITEWETDTMASVEQFVHSLIHASFPKYTKWCMGKYGACQYHQVCTLPAAQRGIMLGSSYYNDVTWSPLVKE